MKKVFIVGIIINAIIFLYQVLNKEIFDTGIYVIKYGNEKYTVKGLPKFSDKYVTFNQWPENTYWKIPNNDSIKYIKEIKSLDTFFGNSCFWGGNKTGLSYTYKKLSAARKEGYSDNEIWEFLQLQNNKFSEVKKEGYTLEQVFDFFDPEFDIAKPYKVIETLAIEDIWKNKANADNDTSFDVDAYLDKN